MKPHTHGYSFMLNFSCVAIACGLNFFFEQSTGGRASPPEYITIQRVQGNTGKLLLQVQLEGIAKERKFSHCLAEALSSFFLNRKTQREKSATIFLSVNL